MDARLTNKIYNYTTILRKDEEGIDSNPWDIKTGSLFHMSGDSNLFNTYIELVDKGANLIGNKFYLNDDIYFPLYEGKMIYIYNHHYGIWPKEGPRPNTIPVPPIEHFLDINSNIFPWYWVLQSKVEEHLIKKDSHDRILWKWEHSWFIAFRKITNSLNERTFIVTIIPRTAANDNTQFIYCHKGVVYSCVLCAMLASLTLDYVSRQKLGSSSMSFFVTKQLPVISPDNISQEICFEIIKRHVKLTYFNHDLDGFAKELWEELTDEQRKEIPELGRLEPYVYNEENRHILQSELDAIFAHLYGLNTEDLRYILDPEDVCGPGCINETFRVLKDNEIRKYGEYRTKRLVMEAWERFGYNN